jgi:hypothetical protein
MKDAQWKAFRKKLGHHHLPESFAEIISNVERFNIPVIQSIIMGRGIPEKWVPPGPWIN